MYPGNQVKHNINRGHDTDSSWGDVWTKGFARISPSMARGFDKAGMNRRIKCIIFSPQTLDTQSRDFFVYVHNYLRIRFFNKLAQSSTAPGPFSKVLAQKSRRGDVKKSAQSSYNSIADLDLPFFFKGE